MRTLIGSAFLWLAPLAIAATPGVLGKTAPPIVLKDFAGKPFLLDAEKDARLVVVAFLGVECPLVKLYAHRLEKLSTEYRDKGVRFVAIDANCQDTLEEMATFAKQHGLTIPFLKDLNSTVADGFRAERTPEVFVLDRERTIRYRGRIDDQFGVVTRKTKASRRDLAEAIDELLANKPVSQPELSAPGCLIGRAPKPVESASATASVTYSRHIAPLFQKRCVECHREGEIGPFSLMSYRDTVGWGETIREVTGAGRMPPWFADPKHGKFSNDMRLSPEEKQLIDQWVKAGCPEGDPADLPPAPTFTVGWNIPEPDLVLKMSDRSFHVPAEGTIDYKHYVIDPKFTEDKWVVASEARPGNRSVVHHILVFLKPPGQHVELVRGSLLAAYAPGMPPRLLPKGMAKKIPAGSKIILQIHYTANGSPQEDISTLGLKFCDAKDVVQRVESGWATNMLFAIPPKAGNYPVGAVYQFSEDRILFNLTPHMHVRGKAFRFEAEYPDGRREILLDVPRFDFNWQLEYELAVPKVMPKGTRLKCLAHFDNSTENLSNPNPNRWVTFGEQTWDEMMIGFFTVATLPGKSTAQSPAPSPDRGGQ